MRGVALEDSISEKDLVQAPILGALSLPPTAQNPHTLFFFLSGIESISTVRDCSIKLVRGAQGRSVPIVKGVHDRHDET
jgi:hypothetical protein